MMRGSVGNRRMGSVGAVLHGRLRKVFRRERHRSMGVGRPLRKLPGMLLSAEPAAHDARPADPRERLLVDFDARHDDAVRLPAPEYQGRPAALARPVPQSRSIGIQSGPRLRATGRRWTPATLAWPAGSPAAPRDRVLQISDLALHALDRRLLGAAHSLAGPLLARPQQPELCAKGGLLFQVARDDVVILRHGRRASSESPLA